MTDNTPYSTMIGSGKTTYFLDVNEAKNGKCYLSITETNLNGEGRKRTVIRVFRESVEQFRQAIDEAARAALP